MGKQTKGKAKKKDKFPCDECEKMFTRSDNLLAHKRAKHSNLQSRINCMLCPKDFCFKRNSVTHLKNKPHFKSIEEIDELFLQTLKKSMCFQ